MSIHFTGPDNLFEPITSIKMYSDSTPMVKTVGWNRIVDRADTMTVKAESLYEFVTAMFLVDAITTSGGYISKLVLPYVPGARQDRVNPTGDVLFTAGSVADMINERRFREVVILDPHSVATTNMIYNVVTYPLARIAMMLPNNNWDAVIAPDKGGVERAREMASALGIGVVYASKVRDVSTGKLSGFDVSVEAGKHYLVSDDICDGGGTFIGLGEKILDQGATADLFVSHGIFSKGTDGLKKIYKTIFTTDSRHVNDRNKVSIVNVVKDMENYR